MVDSLRPLALLSASLKPILWDGGRKGETYGVASQPTKVSFRANKNRWITENVEGASYQTANLPDALHTDCSKCSEKQKEGSDKVIHFLIDNKPELWKELEAKFDPQGEYKKKYNGRQHV
uniref:Uncharacterized protein n=1 Tax=Timema bartmani TaxID=61472 RepID=A0A7R9F3C3_9NEOP|nr:unnamed protein product [Timema bartmani]